MGRTLTAEQMRPPTESICELPTRDDWESVIRSGDPLQREHLYNLYTDRIRSVAEHAAYNAVRASLQNAYELHPYLAKLRSNTADITATSTRVLFHLDPDTMDRADKATLDRIQTFHEDIGAVHYTLQEFQPEFRRNGAMRRSSAESLRTIGEQVLKSSHWIARYVDHIAVPAEPAAESRWRRHGRFVLAAFKGPFVGFSEEE